MELLNPKHNLIKVLLTTVELTKKWLPFHSGSYRYITMKTQTQVLWKLFTVGLRGRDSLVGSIKNSQVKHITVKHDNFSKY